MREDYLHPLQAICTTIAFLSLPRSGNEGEDIHYKIAMPISQIKIPPVYGRE